MCQHIEGYSESRRAGEVEPLPQIEIRLSAYPAFSRNRFTSSSYEELAITRSNCDR
jgi:hypothetical protein